MSTNSTPLASTANDDAAPVSGSTSRGRTTTSKVVSSVNVNQPKKPSSATTSSSRPSIASTANKPKPPPTLRTTNALSKPPTKPSGTATSSAIASASPTTKTPTKPPIPARRVSTTSATATATVTPKPPPKPKPTPTPSKPVRAPVIKATTSSGEGAVKCGTSLRQSITARGTPSSNPSTAAKRPAGPSTPQRPPQRKASASGGFGVKKNVGVQPAKPGAVSKPLKPLAASVPDQPKATVDEADANPIDTAEPKQLDQNTPDDPSSEKLSSQLADTEDSSTTLQVDGNVETEVVEQVKTTPDIPKVDDDIKEPEPTPTSEPDATLPGAEPSSTLPVADGGVATEEPIRIAAQSYPWAYMASTLDACFDPSESKATVVDLPAEGGAEEVSASGNDHNEVSVEFYDTFSSIPFAKDAPRLMQLFHSHGDACEKAESEALKLANQPVSELDVDDDQPMKAYYDALERLDKLHDDAIEIEASILRIVDYEKPSPLNIPLPDSPGTSEVGDENPQTEAGPSSTEETDLDEKTGDEADKDENQSSGSNVELESAHAQLVRVFAACLPILKARKANLIMAQELLDSAQENLSISLRMESLGL